MSMSETKICNKALALLGEKAIISLDDDTVSAQLCKTMYPFCRDAVLEEFGWTFATRWYNLPKEASPDIGEYTNAFPIPIEILQVTFVGTAPDYPVAHTIDTEGVRTNSTTCMVQGIFKQEDPNKYSSLFIEALAQRIAAELSIPIVNSQSLTQGMYSVFEEKLKRAVAKDGQQSTSKRIRSTWLNRARITNSVTNFGPNV